MNRCPRCLQDTLIEVSDNTLPFKARVCPKCSYYESDSPAYATSPELFRNLGRVVLRNMDEKAMSLDKFGLTFAEAQAWLKQEPDFNKQIVKGRDDKLTEHFPCASSKSTLNLGVKGKSPLTPNARAFQSFKKILHGFG